MRWFHAGYCSRETIHWWGCLSGKEGNWGVYRVKEAWKSFTSLVGIQKYGDPHIWVTEESGGGSSLGISKSEVSHFPGKQKSKQGCFFSITVFWGVLGSGKVQHHQGHHKHDTGISTSKLEVMTKKSWGDFCHKYSIQKILTPLTVVHWREEVSVIHAHLSQSSLLWEELESSLDIFPGDSCLCEEDHPKFQ